MKKSTIEEIRTRFDKDVERFSNLDSGQLSTIDAKISLELITESAKELFRMLKIYLTLDAEPAITP